MHELYGISGQKRTLLQYSTVQYITVHHNPQVGLDRVKKDRNLDVRASGEERRAT